MYKAEFTNCTFQINDNYRSTKPFKAHIRMTGVEGVGIYGCDFVNSRSDQDADDLTDYGYGVLSEGSGFVVSAISPDDPDECESPCDRSTFVGLGYGVAVLPGRLKNNFYGVGHSDFSNCYVGISVDGVSAGSMLYNRFYLGEVPDPGILNGDQLGILVRNGIQGFDLQENQFESDEVNVNNTLGVVCGNLGSSNNVVRKNTFHDLTIPNEAYGENGQDVETVQGLVYLCNDNNGTVRYDFYVPDYADDYPPYFSGYSNNTIRKVQSDYVSLLARSSGNIFASSGDETVGDFFNNGSYSVFYRYYSGSAAQYPDHQSGLTTQSDPDPNACATQHGYTPAPIDISIERDSYLEKKDLLFHASAFEEWDTATACKLIMDENSLRAIQWYLQDTSTYNDDSLLFWYRRMYSPMGYILASKHKAFLGDFTTASAYLALASSTFDLSSAEEDDLEDIQDIYDILSSRSIESLTHSDSVDLEEISTHGGHGAAMSRGILSQLGYTFGPEYTIPEEEEEFFAPQKPNQLESPSLEVFVYPNPTDGRNVQVYLPSPSIYGNVEITDVHGRVLLLSRLSRGSNHLLTNLAPGMYYYRVVNNDGRFWSGKIFVSFN